MIKRSTRFGWPRSAALALGMLLGGLVLAGGDRSATSRAHILRDIQYLASDELEGRGVGSQGLDRAADYVRDQFRQAGLQPGLSDSSYFQAFPMAQASALGQPTELALRGPDGVKRALRLNDEFVPLDFKGPGTFEGPLVFAGYGITAPEYKYDDYAAVDVQGKVVMVMRHEPLQSDQADPHAPFQGRIDTTHARFAAKGENAARHGAVAVVFVNDPYSLRSQKDEVMPFGRAGGTSGVPIPLAHVTREVADAMLSRAMGSDLGALEAAIDKDLKPHTRPLDGWSVVGRITIEKKNVDVKNVLGVAEGSGPHADETIVIGAHYDHLGRGGPGSLAIGSHEIHNGADDNASGTAGLIELARRFAIRQPPLPRRLVFAAFTGEELGLVGSAYYVNHPVVPLEQTIAMVNMDMIGRLRQDRLVIYGTGTASEFSPLLESLNAKHHFEIKAVAGGSGRSDQDSFWPLRIPVLHFFTDNHEDYHKPSDHWEKINVEGLDQVLGLVEDTVVALASAETRPAYTVPPEKPARDAVAGDRPYLGTIPSYSSDVAQQMQDHYARYHGGNIPRDAVRGGVMLDGVAPGGPAEQAGVRRGDILIRLGDQEIKDLEDFQSALVGHQPGDSVRITVLRGDLRVTYPVTLGQRPQE